MAKIKPIGETPELSGEDAERLIRDVLRPQRKESIEYNKKMHKMLMELLEESKS